MHKEVIMNKPAIIYARTAVQEEGSTKNRSQIFACKALARKSGRLTIVDTISDEATIGFNSLDRLNRLLNHCKSKKARALIVYNTERLSRNFDDYKNFKRQLELEDIALITAAPCLNDAKEMCERYYLALRSENIRRGMSLAIKKRQ